MSGIQGSRITGLVLVLLVIGGVVAWTLVQKAEYERESRERLISDIATIDGYDADRALIDPIVERAHDVAFDAAYHWRLPSKRSSRRPAFQPETYHQHVYVEIISALKAAGREDLAVAVERVRARK